MEELTKNLGKEILAAERLLSKGIDTFPDNFVQDTLFLSRKLSYTSIAPPNWTEEKDALPLPPPYKRPYLSLPLMRRGILWTKVDKLVSVLKERSEASLAALRDKGNNGELRLVETNEDKAETVEDEQPHVQNTSDSTFGQQPSSNKEKLQLRKKEDIFDLDLSSSDESEGDEVSSSDESMS